MHHFDSTPVDAFDASIRVPSALDPQTTFLHTGLGARPPEYFFLEPRLCSVGSDPDIIRQTVPNCNYSIGTTLLLQLRRKLSNARNNVQKRVV